MRTATRLGLGVLWLLVTIGSIGISPALGEDEQKLVFQVEGMT